ncbi:MAG: UDP-3-O-(3-hydroxymyristoyl)glucosamine N-acyltransferase [Verrucomicrobiae bacterium]|nr:UDP-3-O-(3-hydroxymyristoyl)glucosamine N-acyltransferase [Verrucomicrobiae bacterium]
MTLTTSEIAKQLDGEVLGDPEARLTGFASADQAKPGDLTFADTAEYFTAAEASAATAVIAGKEFTSATKVIIRVANPRVAYAKAVALFFPEPEPAPGIHPTAVVAKSAQIDATAHIGPHCTIGERVKIGARAALLAGDHVGDDSVIGDGTKLFPNVTLYPRTQIGKRVRIHSSAVIGADGFGYVFDAGFHRKVPQIGHVVIGDDVEIGANSCVDRGALGATVIGRGTKIDNQVQVAHNVQTGEHCLLISQVGISGSTKLGSYVVIAGQAGLAGHLKIGNQVTIGAAAGVMTDIPDGAKYLGVPAQPDREFKRQVIAIQRLPDLIKRFAAWEKKMGGQ